MIWRRQTYPAAGILSSGIVLRSLNIAAEAPAAGCRILFFSDTHFRFDKVSNTCSESPLKAWSETEEIGNAIIRSVDEISPDVLIFGGDLVSHTTLYPAAFELLSRMKAPLKLAVFGNWEWKTRKWLPSSVIEQGFKQAGFQLLFNDSIIYRGIQFSGVEDYRFGYPAIPEAEPKTLFRCLISHNPDVIGKSSPEDLAGYHLALCGHTHGGQIRIPLFGAVRTSSVFWKRFEYGLCRVPGKPPVSVSSGIGATYIMKRFRCPPEMLLISIQDKDSQKNYSYDI